MITSKDKFVKFMKEDAETSSVICHMVSEGCPVTVVGINGSVWQVDGHLSREDALEQVKSKLN